MSAFDEIERIGEEPASHLVSQFDYLNASARPEAALVRNKIDEWLADYPLPNRTEMIGRLRSRDDTLHRSAFFELLLHALMLRRGLRIAAIEPTLANGRSPDFLVEAPDGNQFYLEATLAFGRDNVEAGADRRMREALQAIDDVNSPDFFLHLHTRGTPARPVAVGRLRKAVQRFVDNLDYDAAVQAAEAGEAPGPIWRHEEHGAHLRIQPVPKNIRRAEGRAIGGRMLPGGLVNPEVAIKSAVEGKAGRYGDLDLPLIVAVNALEEFASITDAIDALFGTAVLIVSENGEERRGRDPDGAWRGLGGPVYTRCSAVLFVERLSAWSIGQRTLRLILNPWAQNPLPDLPLGIEIRQVIEDRLVTNEGHSLAELFGLEQSWPE